MVLVIEDDNKLRKLIKRYLGPLKLEIDEAKDGKEALEKLAKGLKYSVFIVDINMPKMDGLMFSEELRKFCDAPIIIISGDISVKNRVEAHSKGANWFIEKPFTAEHLQGIVCNYLKDDQRYSDETFSFDLNEKLLKIQGKEVKLTKKEGEILATLIKNSGKKLTRQKIIDNVWGYLTEINDRAVDNHIKNLRSKLSGHAYKIQAVNGEGYMWSDSK